MSTLSFDPADPVALAQALIRCPSVTPDAGGAVALLAEVLAEEGFEVHRPVFSDHDTPDVENLYARIGPDRPALAFAGHVDVVPPGELALWTHPPFGGEIVDGDLVGRGAVDMKGGVAASVAAALRHRRAGGSATIAFLITGDEEGPAINGMAKLLAWAKDRGEQLGHCLLGEPTNPTVLGDAIKIGRRGSLSGRLVVEGIQGHVAYPHLAENPIPGLMRLLAALSEPLDGGNAHFAASNLEITSVDVGNPAFNVIPARARAAFNIRSNDNWSREALEAMIRTRLERAAPRGLRYRLSFERSHSDAFLTQPGPFVAMVEEAIAAETGRRPERSTAGGTSDARFIKSVCPVVEFGLVGKTMHQVDERVSVADLETLTRIYESVLARYVAA